MKRTIGNGRRADLSPGNAPEVNRSQRPAPLEFCLSIMGLAVLGLSHPLLEILGEGPEFFLAHDLSKTEIVAFVFAVGTIGPVLLGVLAAGGVMLGRHMGPILGSCALGIVSAAATGWMLKAVIPEVSAWPYVLACALVGAFLVWLFNRSISARTGFKLLSIAIAVVPALFLGTSASGRLVTQGESHVGPIGLSGSTTSAVLLVLDEFPLYSLLDEDGAIDSSHFPNFAKLAADGVWFRNAVTTQRVTQFAVPAILSGKNPDHSLIPIAADHPENLLHYLSGSHDVFALEQMTALCAHAICDADSESAISSGSRWRRIIRDAGVVLAHVVLPSDFGEGLPRIDQGWAGFGGVAEQDTDRVELGTGEGLRSHFRAAIEADRGRVGRDFFSRISIETGRPKFYFAHFMLPHAPWEFLPDGRRYSRVGNPGANGSGWERDRFLVAQAYQRHLLQVQFVDSLVGELIGRLHEVGKYDDTVIAIVGDHGISFRPGIENRRGIADETLKDIVSIPLIVKPASSDLGYIDDRRAEIVDVAPTLAGLIGVELPWNTDGIDLLGRQAIARDATIVYGEEPVTLDRLSQIPMDLIAEKFAFFQSGDPLRLAPIEFHGYLGETFDSGDMSHALEIEVTLDTVGVVKEGSWELPIVVSGEFDAEIPEGKAIGLIANGVVAAVVTPFVEDDGHKIQAFLPPEHLVAGENVLEAVVLDERG